MPRKVTVKVTAQDIVKGVPEDSCKCPVGRALRRLAGARADVDVSGDSISVNGFEFSPPEVETFVDRFDVLCRLGFDGVPPKERRPLRGRARLKLLKPFKFTLTLPF